MSLFLGLILLAVGAVVGASVWGLLESKQARLDCTHRILRYAIETGAEASDARLCLKAARQCSALAQYDDDPDTRDEEDEP